MEYPLNATTVVVHGPEIFDSGEAERILALFRPRRVIVAGVMARTAAEESGIPCEFDGRPPSRVIRDMSGPVFLANRGKTGETGRVFGGMVASRLGGRGLVHLECAAGIVFCWGNGDAVLAGALARCTGYAQEALPVPEPGEEDMRTIHGCLPGEAVYVNGIVIGTATGDPVVIAAKGGTVAPVSGIDPKPHGIEKLERAGVTDIGTAWCKSGHIRAGLPQQGEAARAAGRVLVIDHCGHDIYRLMPDDCCGVLAIGDDTTAVCGHVCSHRGIPVLGIVDGDIDVIVPSAFARGSVVAEAVRERDDDLGREIAGMVPGNTTDWHAWVGSVLGYLGSRVRIRLDLRKRP